MFQGLESLFDVPVPMSLVSQGCEVIHIPRNKFREIADDQTLDGKITRSGVRILEHTITRQMSCVLVVC